MWFPSRGSSFQSQVCKLGEQMVCCHTLSGPQVVFLREDQRGKGLRSPPCCLPSGHSSPPERHRGAGRHHHLAFWKRGCSYILTSLVRENFPFGVLSIQEAKQTSGHIVPFLRASLSTQGFQTFVPSFLYFPPYHLAERSISPPIQGAIHSPSPLVSAPGPDGNFPVAFCGLQSCNLPPSACRLSLHLGLSEQILVWCGRSG